MSSNISILHEPTLRSCCACQESHFERPQHAFCNKVEHQLRPLQLKASYGLFALPMTLDCVMFVCTLPRNGTCKATNCSELNVRSLSMIFKAPQCTRPFALLSVIVALSAQVRFRCCARLCRGQREGCCGSYRQLALLRSAFIFQNGLPSRWLPFLLNALSALGGTLDVQSPEKMGSPLPRKGQQYPYVGASMELPPLVMWLLASLASASS